MKEHKKFISSVDYFWNNYFHTYNWEIEKKEELFEKNIIIAMAMPNKIKNFNKYSKFHYYDEIWSSFDEK